MEQQALSKKIVVNHINIRQSISILLFKIILLDLVSAVFTIGYFATVTFSTNVSITGAILSVNALFFILLGCIKIFITMYVILDWFNEYFEVRPNQIIHRKGFFKRDEEILQFDIIRAIKLYQSLPGRFFDFGTIELYDERRNKRMTLYLIHDPHRHMKIFDKLIDKPNQEEHTIRPHFMKEDTEE